MGNGEETIVSGMITEWDRVIQYLEDRIARLENDGPEDSIENMETIRRVIYEAAKCELRAAIRGIKSLSS